ncbi:hypothetical protein BEL04_23705 [Mucilaginibacter sp. PPCGB 2223]|nr:hypothetical protein BEL04_23705 [Mucilaginibacter sp. PPCGB 2223]
MSVILSAAAQNRKRTEGSRLNVEYPIAEANAKELGLKKLADSEHRHHYRFSTEGQIVEIWTDDDVTYQGFLLNYIYHRKGKGGYQHNILSKKESVYTDKAKQIIAMYDSLALNGIPTEERIANWQKGLDGGDDIVEFADRDSYSIKTYWEPAVQERIPGIYIKKFFNRLEVVFQLGRKYKSFQNELPIGNYYIGMMMVTKTVKFGAKGGSSLFRK